MWKSLLKPFPRWVDISVGGAPGRPGASVAPPPPPRAARPRARRRRPACCRGGAHRISEQLPAGVIRSVKKNLDRAAQFTDNCRFPTTIFLKNNGSTTWTFISKNQWDSAPNLQSNNPSDAILNFKTRRFSSSIFLKTCIGQTPTERKRAYEILN